MDLTLTLPLLVLAGLGIGTINSVPVGPVNILCIQRTLSSGYWAGVTTGLGAVAGDFVLASIGAFGLTAIQAAIAEYRPQIQAVGGLLLLGFGARLLTRRVRIDLFAQPGPAVAQDAAVAPQAFVLTVTNPGAALALIAMVSGLSTMMDIRTYAEASVLVLSVMAGGLLWWMALAWLVSRYRKRIDERRLAIVNQFAGVVLLGLGVGLLGRVAVNALG